MWSHSAPKIAGLPMFANDAAAMKFMRTGIDAKGAYAKGPMPRYRFNANDAASIVAYLRSLPK
ncbi:MAG: hypothetical protein ACREM6_14595 [Vulcanimicrobiaceae bacterium]